MLKPNQIGLLAAFVKQAIDKFPEVPDDDPRPSEEREKVASDESLLEPWEEELRRLVDGSPGLPDYDEMEEADANLMDYLINYF